MVSCELLYPADFSEPTRYTGHYATMIARKLDASLQISRVVIDALQGLKMSYPKLTRARRSELRGIRKQLAK